MAEPSALGPIVIEGGQRWTLQRALGREGAGLWVGESRDGQRVVAKIASNAEPHR